MVIERQGRCKNLTGTVLKGRIRIIIISMALGLHIMASGQRVTGLSAGEAFARGDYSEAFEHYNILLESFPRDPLYLYGAGVSLVMLEKRASEASALLEKSLSYSSSIREVPSDAAFYLGRAYHMQGKFGEAVDAYNLFAINAGRRAARSYGVTERIKECEEGFGKLMIDDVDDKVVADKVVAEPVEIKPILDSIDAKPSQVLVPLSDVKDSLLTQALELRYKADSLVRTTGVAASAAAPGRSGEVANITLQVDDSKARAIELSGQSDSLLSLAGVMIPTPEKRKNTMPENEKMIVQTVVAEDLADSMAIKSEPVIKADVEPLVSYFEIKSSPYYSSSLPIPVFSSFPSGLIYTVQLAVFRNPVAPSYFRRLYPVFGIRNEGSDLTYYYSGLFRSAEGASKVVQRVRDEGFRDAFVVIFMDGKPVSQERGTLLEKEWGGRELNAWDGVIISEQTSQVIADTVPPTLLFRVEVMRTNKEVSPVLADELSKIAAGRGLQIMTPSNDIYVYIVGKFLTFESASDYADLLKRNGYKDSRVVAYLGNREIPVETALKFFER